MFDGPICSIKEAKEYFRSMGCSHFHMAREYPERYEEYKQLGISKQTEIKWKEEQLNEYYEKIIDCSEEKFLWIIHSSMDDLVESLKTESALKVMLEATRHICDRVPFNDRVIVSETINGRSDRKYRSGLIYLAYDLNDISSAREFVELSLYFATYVDQRSRSHKRCQESIDLCIDIKYELGLVNKCQAPNKRT